MVRPIEDATMTSPGLRSAIPIRVTVVTHAQCHIDLLPGCLEGSIFNFGNPRPQFVYSLCHLGYRAKRKRLSHVIGEYSVEPCVKHGTDIKVVYSDCYKL